MKYFNTIAMTIFGVQLEFVLVSAVSLFTIVNPLGATPFFLANTDRNSPNQIRYMAKRASLASGLVLIFFGLFGRFVFSMMGISLSAFRIAGGVLVFIAALDMLKGANVRSRTLPEEQEEAVDKDDISLMPVAIPLLAGPGAISTVIVLMTRAHTFAEAFTVMLMVVIVSLCTYVILLKSSLLMEVLSPNGVRVMNRLMGLLLAAISIQFVINGIKELIPELADSVLKSL